jgi:hypothetical protein
MSWNYLGGIHKKGNRQSDREIFKLDWTKSGPATQVFARNAPGTSRLYWWDDLAVLVAGYLNAGPSNDIALAAEEIRCHYLDHETLDAARYEGNFTLAIMDARVGRIILYRNLIGTGSTYYHASPDGFIFGGNLVEVVEAAAGRPAPNRDTLPSLFLFRSLPGRETLFSDYYRLLPGEQVAWDSRGLTRLQKTTLADLREERPIAAHNAIDRLDSVMTSVLTDCASVRPGMANLLSGEVESSYLQTIWNRHLSQGQKPALSFSFGENHAAGQADTLAALIASQSLGTRHALAGTDGPLGDHLITALQAAGEPLDLPSAFCRPLAQHLVACGTSGAICSRGASALFGLEKANQIHQAILLRKLVPGRLVRKSAANIFGALGWAWLANICRLVDKLEDENSLRHPVNLVSSCDDRVALESCFGPEAIADAAYERRRLLDLLGVPNEPMSRLHGAILVAEGMDNAGLKATLFTHAGATLLCPFLDSRVIRLALNLPASVRFSFCRPVGLVRNALARLGGPSGLPPRKPSARERMVQCLGPGGPLAPFVEQIRPHHFLPKGLVNRLGRRPTPFLYTLLVYDFWYRLFIERTLALPQRLRTASLHDHGRSLAA